MSNAQSFEDWWNEHAPTPPPDPVTLAAVQRVLLVPIVERIPEPPFATFAKAVSYVVDIQGSLPIILNPNGSFIISTKLILPEPICLNLTGLGQSSVASLYATISTEDRSLILEATMDSQPSQPPAKFSITMTQPFSPASYFQAIGYTPGPKPPAIAAVFTSIVGPATASTFFTTLPNIISSTLSPPLATWELDPEHSEIRFSLSPFGTDVRSATLAAVIPPLGMKIQLAGSALKFELEHVSLSIKRRQGSYNAPYDMAVEIVAYLSSGGIELQLLGTFSRLDKGPYRFSSRVLSPTSLANIFKVLPFPFIPNSIKLPLGGPSIKLDVPLPAVGISFVQQCNGAVSVLTLDEFFFKFGIEEPWKPWEGLPSSLGPEQASDVSLTVMIKPAPTNVGLQLDYSLNFPNPAGEPEKSSSVNLRITCWPFQATQIFTPGTTPLISARLDTHGRNPPSIGTILKKIVTNSESPWADAQTAIPILGHLAETISIIEASLEMTKGINNKYSITTFSIEVRIGKLTLLPTPPIEVTSTNLIVIYEKAGWKAALRSHLLFANRFSCIADMVLPTKTEPGFFRFDNLDDNFTLGELAKLVDPKAPINLISVPIVGSSTLETLRLGHFGVQVRCGETDNIHHLSALEVELTFGSQNIGQIRTFENRLIIRWQKLTDNKNWMCTIGWEGQIGASWHLSAGIRYTSDSTSKTIIGGDISNIRGRTAASELVNSLTWTEADPVGTPTVWEDTLPSTVSSSFSLDRCSVLVELGPKEAKVHMVSGRASWGRDSQFAAVLLVEKLLVKEAAYAWGFTFALAVENFRFADVYKDSELATLVDTHLTIPTAFVLAFLSPNITNLSAVRQRLSDLKAWEKLGQGSNLQPIHPFVDTGEVKGGLFILASLDLRAANPGSLSNNLAVIDSKLVSSNITASCYLSKDAQTNVTFKAAITSIQPIPALLVKDIKLSFALPTSGATPSMSKFELEAECVVSFPETQTWSLLGKSTITESTATLASSTPGGTLLELGNLQLKQIELRVDYAFSSTTQTGNDTPNEGVVNYGDRYGKYVIELSATIALGSVESECYLIFMSGSVGALVIAVPGTLNIGVLFQSLFGSGFPAELLDISFTNLLIYYAWNASSTTPSGQPGPSSGKYFQGFHAEAATSVYGIAFDLSADILTNEGGITIAANKATPFEVVCITLYSKDDTTKGPSFGLSTIAKTCFVEAGISLFGTDLGFITLTYSSSRPGLRGDVTVHADFLPGGSAEVSFELNNNNQLHFVNLPCIVDVLIDASEVIKTIRELSEAENNPCGAIILAFLEKIFQSKFSVDVKLSDSQESQSPEEGIPSQVKFDVTGRFDLTIGSHLITEVVFDPLAFTVYIPRSLELFKQTLEQSLKDSAFVIIKGLWDNKEKLAEVIALVALKELTAQAIATLICRNYYNPRPDPLDDPDPTQTPDRPDDGGGPDGDTGLSGGGGRIEAVAGSVAAAIAGKEGATIATLAGILLALYAALVPSPPPTPTPHPLPPGPLKPPPLEDPYAQQINDALNKVFDRWYSESKNYKTALNMALQCCLEYRDAIVLLRKVVTKPSIVAELGAKRLKDYKLRRTKLVYDFSELRSRFATKWLAMPDEQVSVRLFSDAGKRKVEVKWTPLCSDESIKTAVALYFNGIVDVKRADNTVTVTPQPSFDGLRVTAKVFTFAATWGGDPKYAFFAQGEPATRVLVDDLPAAISTEDATKQPEPPAGLQYIYITDPAVPTSIGNNKDYPVFRVGPYVYWVLGYRHLDKFEICAFDQDNKEVKCWTAAGACLLWKIDLDFESKKVKLFGLDSEHVEKRVELEFEELTNIYSNRQPMPSVPDPLVPLIATADARAQPNAPDGLKYSYLDGDSASYPVLCYSGLTYWALSYDNNRVSLCILGYDADMNLVKRLPKDGARHISRIVVEGSTVRFIGQADQSVSFTLQELAA